MPARLTRSFYARDTRIVARELLGMRLVHDVKDVGRLSGTIVETEAYCQGDSTSHAYRGRTLRNSPMYGEAGFTYVYFTYGMHYCFNIVTESVEIPAAVLIRALEPVEGLQQMTKNRALTRAHSPTLRDLCRGPARLCQAMNIDRTLDGYNLVQPSSELFIEEGIHIHDNQIQAAPRVRVHGTKSDVNQLWRWFIRSSTYVSS